MANKIFKKFFNKQEHSKALHQAYKQEYSKVLHQAYKQEPHDRARLVYTIAPNTEVEDIQTPAINEIIELIGTNFVLYSSNETVDGFIFDFLNKHLNISNKEDDFNNLSVYNNFDFITIANNNTSILVSFENRGSITLTCRDIHSTNTENQYQKDNFENIIKSSLNETTICSSRTISNADSQFLVLDSDVTCKKSTMTDLNSCNNTAKIIPLFTPSTNPLENYRTLTCKNNGFIVTPNGIEPAFFEDKTKIINDVTNSYQINIANDFVHSSQNSAISPFYFFNQAFYFNKNNNPLQKEEQDFIKSLRYEQIEEIATYIVNQSCYDSKNEKECDRKLLIAQLKSNPEQADKYLKRFKLDNNIITASLNKAGLLAIQSNQNISSIVKCLSTSRSLKFETQKSIEDILKDTISSYGENLQDVQVTFFNNIANIIRVSGTNLDDTIIEIGKESVTDNSQDMYKNCTPMMQTTSQTITIRNANLCTQNGNILTNVYSSPPSSNIYTRLDFSDTKPIYSSGLVENTIRATTKLDICLDEEDSSMFVQKSFSKHIEKYEEEPYDSPTLTKFIANISTNYQGQIAITPIQANSLEQ